MLDALALLKAARAHRVPAALEVSRSGVGAHVWTFSTAPVPAGVARRLGIGLLREVMGIRGRDRSVCGGGLRLPSAGHPVPRCPDLVLGSACPVRRPDPAPVAR